MATTPTATVDERLSTPRRGRALRVLMALAAGGAVAASAVAHFRADGAPGDDLAAGYERWVNGEDEAARRVAVRQIADEPLSAGALALLSLSSPGPSQETRANRLALDLDHRNLPANLVAFETALEERDHRVAAEAADRLMRTASDPRAALIHAYRLERSRRGREALIARLESKPEWATRWLASAGDHPAMRGLRAEAIAASPGATLGCPTVAPMAAALLDSFDRRRAEGVWRRHCPPGGRLPAIADPRFLQTSPFGWRRVRSPALQVDFLPQGGVSLSNPSRISRPALRQAVALPPGRYRLMAEGTAQPFVFAQVTCDNAERPVRDDIVRVPDCDTQRLTVWIEPTPEPLILQKVGLEPL